MIMKFEKNNQEEIIEIIDNYEHNLNQKLKNINSELNNHSLKKDFINILKFGKENYSLLNIAVLNDWQKLVTYLINEWPIDIDYKDNSGNSAWNHACMLLQSKNTLTIKKEHQLTYKNKVFIKQLIPLSPNWNPIEKKEINKNASENRKKIIDYYMPKDKNSIESWEHISSIDLQMQNSFTNESNTLKFLIS
ncbi:hypothetical protein SIXOD_v1c23620 [Spiroplasma ixodetis Y32]|nr:hypothetical protein SIXOD_v1c23620 [Spiroplasma ixodetis Y32]